MGNPTTEKSPVVYHIGGPSKLKTSLCQQQISMFVLWWKGDADLDNVIRASVHSSGSVFEGTAG